MASAKERYYANQAKKGKITKAQASSAIAGKGLNVQKKVAPSGTAKASVLNGAGPLAPNQVRAPQGIGPVASGAQYASMLASVPQGIGPIANGAQYAANVERSRKEQASKSTKVNKSSSRSLASGAFNYQNNYQPDRSKDTLSQGNTSWLGGIANSIKGAASDLFSSIGKNSVDTGQSMAAPSYGMSDQERALARNQAFGIPTANASDDGLSALGRALQKESTPDIPTGYGDNGEIFYNGYSGPLTFASDFATPGTNFSRPGSEAAYNRGEDPRNIASGRKTNVNTRYGNGGNTRDLNNAQDLLNTLLGINTANAAGNSDSSGYAPPQGIGPVSSGDEYASMLSNYVPQEPIAPPAWEQTGYQSPKGSVRTRFSGGAAGNGALASNAYMNSLSPEDQSYIKELKNSIKGDFGASAAEKQFKELINALDPTYQLQQDTATQELEKAKQEDINKLQSMFAGNNTSGSEQNQQYVQRTQGDYATQLANLLAKLSASKNQDIAQYRSQLQDRLSKISESKSSAQQRVADLIRQVQQGAADRQLQYAKLNSGGSTKEPNDSLTFVGTQPDGTPVYWNNRTKQQQAFSGLQRQQSNGLSDVLSGIFGGGNTGGYTPTGQYQIDPSDGRQKQVYVDASGTPGFID